MNEILQQRIESVQAGKNITHAQIEAIRTALDHDRTDHVTDIRNHISPNTRVSEAHVNEAFKLNSLG